MLQDPMMEQPTQIPLDFNAPLPEEAEAKLETLPTEELERRYHENTGKNPGFRFRDVTEDQRREYLIEGINNKEAALHRLAEIDAADDRGAKKEHWSN